MPRRTGCSWFPTSWSPIRMWSVCRRIWWAKPWTSRRCPGGNGIGREGRWPVLLYIARRTVEFAASLALASVAIFAFMAVLPGDPAQVALGVNATPAALAETRARFGTDKPLLTQYFDWVSGLPRGDFGRSYVTDEAVGGQILDRLPVTLWLVISAMVLAIAVAVPLGVLAALRRRRPSGVFLSGLSQAGVAVPSFLAGILLVALFAVRLRLLPSSGWTAPVENPIEFGRHL